MKKKGWERYGGSFAYSALACFRMGMLVAASCFFGVTNFRFHLLQVVVLTFLISLVLVAIANIDRPYQGMVKVEPAGFNFATRTLHGGEP